MIGYKFDIKLRKVVHISFYSRYVKKRKLPRDKLERERAATPFPRQNHTVSRSRIPSNRDARRKRPSISSRPIDSRSGLSFDKASG